MDDLVDRLRQLERNPAPDIWSEIEERTQGGQPHLAEPPLRRRWTAGIGAIVIAFAGVGSILFALRPWITPQDTQSSTAQDVTLIDLGQDRHWSGGPLVAGDGAVWIVGSGDVSHYELIRIDPLTLHVTDRISLGFADTGWELAGLAVGEGSVWVSVARSKTSESDRAPGELLRIDEAAGAITDRFAVPPDPRGLAVGYGHVWLATSAGPVARIDPATGRIVDEIDVGPGGGEDVVPAFGSLWVTTPFGQGSLLRIDPSSGNVQARFQNVTNISVGDDGIWVEGEGEPNGAIRLIDPSTNTFRGSPIGLRITPAFVAQGEGQTWLAMWVERTSAPSGSFFDLSDGTFTIRPIDPATGKQLGAPIPMCGGPAQPVIAYGGLWFPCSSRVFHLGLNRRALSDPVNAPPSEAPVPAGAAMVGRIICEKDGTTRVATPDVLAQPDGVHVVIVNLLDESASMIGLGFDVDPGSSTWVVSERPGTIQEACWPFSEHPAGPPSSTTPMTVHDPEGMFVEGELQCNETDDGTALDIRLLASVEGRKDVSITPEEARPLIGGIRDDDIVQLPGYPDTVKQSVVVVRDGRRIAGVGFAFVSGRWIQRGGHVCGGPIVVA